VIEWCREDIASFCEDGREDGSLFVLQQGHLVVVGASLLLLDGNSLSSRLWGPQAFVVALLEVEDDSDTTVLGTASATRSPFYEWLRVRVQACHR
jgi:hypothetical protein